MWRFFHRNYLWLGGIAGGVMCRWQIAGYWLYGAVVLALAGWLGYRHRHRELLILFLAVSAGWFAAWSSTAEAAKDLYLENVPVMIDDQNAMGAAWNEDDPLSYRLSGELLAGPQTGRVQLYLPQHLGPKALESGRTYQVSGNFYTPRPTAEFVLLSPDGSMRNITRSIDRNSYNKYLQTQGIKGTLVVESIAPASEQGSWMMQWRRTALQRLDKNLTGAEHRAVLGAVTLGFRNRLSYEIKDIFNRTGVAHVFSVSGLHVGILAFLVMLILRPWPLYWHVPAVCSLVFYVAATGGAAPAIRAFVMVLMLEFFRSCLLRIRPLEMLSLIAGVLILYNPYYLTDAGFQYSFVVTGMLIAGADPAREIMRAASGERCWWGSTSAWNNRLLKLRGKFFGAVFMALIACAASWSLTLYHQNSFFIGAVIVNLLLIPVLTPLFALAIAKYFLPVWADFWNIFLQWMLDYLLWTVKIFAEWSSAPAVAAPHWLLVTVLLILCAFCLVFRQYPAVIPAAAVGGLCVLALNLSGGLHNEQQLVVISGGGVENPVAAVMLPQAHTMYVLNAGREAVYVLKCVADSYGITHIQQLDIARPVADCADGLKAVQRYWPVSRYRKSSLPVRSALYRKYTAQIAMEPGAEPGILEFPGGKVQIKPLPSGEWQVNYDSKIYTLRRTSGVRCSFLQ